MRVVVGLSGGVDSSWALHWARERGLDAIAVTLVMQDEPVAVPEMVARSRARDLAEAEGVEFVLEDVRDAFAERVVAPFVDRWRRGLSPNPCVLCNRDVKIPALIAVADRLGAERVMTGHYARLARGADGVLRIRRGEDRTRDQSYFLARLAPDQIERLCLPLGERLKADVRAASREARLAASDVRDSTGVCFATEGDWRSVVGAPPQPGPILDEQGRVLGYHEGVVGYTIGQRKGLGLSGGPWFVRSIDPASATISVARGKRPIVGSMTLKDPTLTLAVEAVLDRPLSLQTRYRGPALPARLRRVGERLEAVYEGRGDLAAPGQSAVLYDGDVVLGQATIDTIELI